MTDIPVHRIWSFDPEDGPQQEGDDRLLVIARAALIEAGRPDLAEGVRTEEINIDGLSIPRHDELFRAPRTPDAHIIMRAFAIAHLSHEPTAHVYEYNYGIQPDMYLCCATCWRSDSPKHEQTCPQGHRLWNQ